MKALLYNRILLALAFVGLFVAGYLSIAHRLSADIPCGAAGGCTQLTNSASAYWLKIPVAYYGLLGYVLLAGLAGIRAFKGLESTRKLVMPGYCVAAIGTAASLWLQYQALAVLHEVCVWCLTSALTMVVTLIIYALLAQVVEDAPAGSLPSDRLAVPITGGLVAVLALALVGSSTLLKPGAVKQVVIEDSKVELVPANGHIIGDATSPITIIEFADMYCPACRRASPKMKQFVEAHPGKIRLVFRHFPLLNKHPYAINAALLSEIAAEKGLFWNYLMGVMEKPGEEELSLDELFAIFKSLGLDPIAAEKRIQDDKDPIYARVRLDMKAADELGVNMTPTFLIMMKDQPTVTASSQDVFEKLQDKPYIDVISGK